MVLKRRVFTWVFNLIVVGFAAYAFFVIADHATQSKAFDSAMMWVATTFTGFQITLIVMVLYSAFALGLWALWVYRAQDDASPDSSRDSAAPRHK